MPSEDIHKRRCKRFQVFLMMAPPTEQTTRFFQRKDGTLVSRELELTPEELEREVQLFGDNMRFLGTWPAFIVGLLGLAGATTLFMTGSGLAGVITLGGTLLVGTVLFAAKIRKNGRLFTSVRNQVYKDEHGD